MGDGVTTSALIEEYLREKRGAREHTTKTTKDARCTLAGFAEIAPSDPRRIRQRHIIEWMEAQGVADSTLATYYGRVRCFLQWANRTGRISTDPSYGLNGPRRPRRIPRALDPDEVTHALDTAPSKRLLVAESLMACEGLRLGEVCALQLGDIDWRHRTVRVVQGKGAKDRLVHLTPATASAIRAYLIEAPASSGPLIRSEHDDRSPVSSNRIGRLVSDHLAAVGVKHFPRDGRSPHAFRHTYASDLVDAGCTIVEVAGLMGHDSIETTMIYQRHIDIERTRAAVESRPYAAGLRAVVAAQR